VPSVPRSPGAPDELPPEGPTELVEDDRGELVERLSTGTASLLLAWLIGTGAGSTLLAVGLLARFVFGRPLGLEALFSGPGLYLALLGASGPCLLWLAGRAQGHTFAWFLLTGAKMALLMVAIIVVFAGLAALILGGGISPAGLLPVAWLVGAALALSVVWAVVVWVADRAIARARLRSERE
jgi:hypothetical protein